MIKDVMNKPAEGIRDKKLWLLDMDGTIYNENTIFEGTLDFLRQIRESGGRYIFITNNSSKSVVDYITKVNNMGIEAGYEDFYTSAQATCFYIHENYPGQKIYCQGTKSLVDELKRDGFDVTTEVDDEATIVLTGFDTELNFEKLRNTCIMLGKDVTYLATNPDLVCPVSFGFVPDNGSVAIMLQNATGKYPFFIGKPQPIMVECVLKETGYTKEETIIVGDRLYTDIATGTNAGVDTICVLSGEATMKDIVDGDVDPTYVFNDVKEIYGHLISEKDA